MDKITESEMSDTDTNVMRDKTHGLVIVQVNGEELYVYEPDEARKLGEALLRAAEAVEKVEKAKQPPLPPITAPVKANANA